MTETLWGLTTYFNPMGASSRLANFRAFRERSRRQGLPLVAVELAFGDGPFVLREGIDAEILIQRRSTSVLWQKERLLNLGLAHLPTHCTGVVWADADVLFEDDDWVQQTSRLLEKYVVLQPYSACIRLPEGKRPEEYPSGELERTILQGNDNGTYSKSICSRMSGFRPKFSGTTGYVWSARRAFLDQVGFYDRCIVGGADREMALAVLYRPGRIPEKNTKIRYPRLRAHLDEWHRRVHGLVQRKVGYRPGAVHHLWHGSMVRRNYADRHSILEEHGFDPERDLELDDGGCFRFRSENPALVEAIGAYFESRQEDG